MKPNVMKRFASFFIFFLVLAFALWGASKRSSKRDPRVTVENTVKISGVTLLNDTLYVVRGDSVGLSYVDVRAVKSKPVKFESVVYFLDGKRIPLKKRNHPPHFSTENMTPGRHTISGGVSLRRHDDSLYGVAVNIPLIVVESTDSLPAEAPPVGTYSTTVSVTK